MSGHAPLSGRVRCYIFGSLYINIKESAALVIITKIWEKVIKLSGQNQNFRGKNCIKIESI